MTGPAWKTATWTCGRCGLETSQRFHVPTDGDPAKAPPPEPWTFEVGEGGKSYFCGECSRTRKAERRAEEIPASATFGDCADEEETLAVWADEHLCLRCAHSDLCRFVPTDPSYQTFATIRRCRRFVFDLDRDET